MIFYFGISPSPQKRGAIKMAKHKVDLLFSFFYVRRQDFTEVKPGVFRQTPTALKKPDALFATLERKGEKDLPKVFRVEKKEKKK
jgi:hypothetical protein